MRTWRLAPALVLVGCTCTAGCKEKDKSYETTVEVVQVQRFGQTSGAGIMDLIVRYPECPGEVRRVLRAEKAFSQCIGPIKPGDKLLRPQEGRVEVVGPIPFG
jgi:hypothetical protein